MSAPTDDYQSTINKALDYVRELCTDGGKLSLPKLDDYQQVTLDLAVSTAELQCARNYLDYSESQGEIEQKLSASFSAETLRNIRNRLVRMPSDFGLTQEELSQLNTEASDELLSTASLAALGRHIVNNDGDLGDRGLDEDKIIIA